MVCARCGHGNEDGSRYCSSCGATLGTSEDITLGHEALALGAVDTDLGQQLAPGTALVIVERGPNAGSTYKMGSDEVSVGRHPESDVFLDDITVSRRHSVIERSGSKFSVRDVGSLNGTYVNRERVESRELIDGDELQIGRFSLIFRSGSDS
jgi:pSer/pThr/pTyr-binding forkhead associated (FHA) protein